jgi:hypothetical protein
MEVNITKKTRITKKLATTITLVLTLMFSFALIAPAANAQVPTRKTAAYLSLNPHLIGMGQPLTINLWIYPSPATRTFSWYAEGFTDITITFTKPDGTTDTFMPVDGSGGLEPGESEMIGAIWFLYYPDQVGTWNVQFTMPQQTIGEGSEAVIYEEATSQVVTFEVQSDAVQIGLPPVDLPGPNEYWERPIQADNREWYQISGGWLQARYDDRRRSCFNPYSTAPESAHIVWKRLLAAGGLVGGDWSSLSYPDGGKSPPVFMMGRVYYNMPGGVFHCVDLRTGELIFEAPGSITLGQHLRAETRDPTRGTPETQATSPEPYLWRLGSTWQLYDAFSGALEETIDNVDRPARHSFGSSGTFRTQWFEGDPVVHIIRQSGWNTTIPMRLAENELMKWDYTKVTDDDWETGIVWRTNLKQPDGSGPGEGARGSDLYISVDRTVGVVSSTGEDVCYGYDLTTGAQLYTKKLDYQMMGWYCGPDGSWMAWDSVTRRLHCYDIKTGNERWVTDVLTEYPWGSQYTNPRVYAYDNYYWGSFDGWVYCLEDTTGNLKWKFHVGNTTETVFGNWVPYHDAAVADGKLYFGTTEHTPTQPRIRGNKMFCIDAHTGDEIWRLSSAIEPEGIAEGYLVGVGENDGLMYAFGKGKTETTVSIQNNVVTKGSSVLIEGTVMDMSPAQPNTPAVSDEDMSEWMDYLHMQKPASWDVSGVPVKLIVVHPDGNVEWIYTRTTDMYGNFGHMYVPPTEGLYKVIAQFDGSKSYWPSTAETMVGVTPGSSPAQQFSWQELTEAPITTEVAIIAAVAVGIVIGVAGYWALRKRQ